jgi:hypothetical protein
VRHELRPSNPNSTHSSYEPRFATVPRNRSNPWLVTSASVTNSGVARCHLPNAAVSRGVGASFASSANVTSSSRSVQDIESCRLSTRP